MWYDVTYQIAGVERTDRVDAPDAAAAAASVRDAHGRANDRFELILVHLMEQDHDGEGVRGAVLDDHTVAANA